MDLQVKNFDFAKVKFNEQGLIPVIAQDHKDGAVLMLAYMNKESLQYTLETGLATYWSRSRGKLWKKGEESGHVQHVKEMHIDCDADAIIVKIEQVGGAACHTGHRTCFFSEIAPNGEWKVASKPLFDPEKVYKK